MPLLAPARPRLGLLIGKRGQTIDAVQFLANALVREDARSASEVVVDAAGRERRRATLERTAEQAGPGNARPGGRPRLARADGGERAQDRPLLYLQEREGVDDRERGRRAELLLSSLPPASSA